jgi:hypothetical protein
MRENNENNFQETEAAFALAVLLLNFLVLSIVVGLVWLLQLLISPKSPLIAALGETIWR